MRIAEEERPRGAGHAARRLALVAASLLLAPAVARGQATLEGGRGTLLVPDADPVPLGHGTASLSLSEASGAGLHAAPLGLTFGIWNGVDLGATLLDGAAGDPAARGASRDIRLRTKWRFAIETARRPALALSLQADHLLQGVDLSPSLIAHKNFGNLLVTGELGYRRPGRAGPLDPAGPFYGAALSYQLSSALTASLQTTGETGAGYHALTVLPTVYYSLLGPDPSADLRELLRARGLARRAAIEAEEAGGEPVSPVENALPQGAGQGQPAGAPAAALPAVSRGPLSEPGRVSFFVAAGPTYGGRASFRAFAGVQISTFDEQLVDSDHDGIPDRLDKCPYEPEDWDGYQDEDGCPDHGEEAIRKEARARAARQAAETPRYGTEVPRFRLAVPILRMPAPGAPPISSDAPMYQPLDRPLPAPPGRTAP